MEMMEENEEQTTYSITLENLALGNGEADGENGGTGGGSNPTHTSNFRRATVWINTSQSTGFRLDRPFFWWLGSWTSIVCCVNGTDMDGCNFSLEDSQCAQRVTRNSH